MPRFRFVSPSVLVVGLLTILSTRADAQDLPFGERGSLVLSAERLAGFVHSSQNTSAGGMEFDESVDVFYLLGNPAAVVTGYAWPRLALDGFIAPRVSLGAAATFVLISPENGSATVMMLAPRVGYAAQIGNRLAFWPRLGFTYARVSNDTGGPASVEVTQSLFALTLEAPLVFVLASHATLNLGPTLDLGLGGSRTVSGLGGGGGDDDQTFTEFGLQGGISVYF